MKTNILDYIRKFPSCYRSVVRLFSSALLMTMVSNSLHSAPIEKSTDAEINAAVVNYILVDSSVPSNEIDIATKDGIVMLSGTAPNILAKERATMITEAIKGVRSVVNTIIVVPGKRTDEEISKDMEAALKADPVTEVYEIKPNVEDGTVTLVGTVDSWHAKQIAASVAKGVKGTKAVTNDIAVSYKTERPDSEIAEEIKSILKRDIWIEDVLINSEVKDGKVILSGTVGSVAAKKRASTDVWTAGVKAVDDEQLKVHPWATAGSMTRDEEVLVRSDEWVEQSVKDALRLDPRIGSSVLDVTAKDGLVTLSGTVGNLKAKRAAKRDTLNTTGVWRVRNHLKVRNPVPISDETIALNVKAGLVRHPYVDRYQIGVSVSNGVVKLTGSVDSYFEKLHADDITSSIKGVTSIRNSLTVDFPSFQYYSWSYSWYDNAPYYYSIKPSWWKWTYTDDAEIKNDIEERFHWSPFMNKDNIKVSVNDGVATLTGTVGSRREFNVATENAYHGGAYSVVNKLEIK